MADNRSQLYAQLATLEQAGVPARQALQAVGAETSAGLAGAVSETLRRLDRSETLAAAGRAAKLFQPWEAQLIAAGTEGGQLAAVYQNLARHWEHTTLRWRQLKSRLVLPAVVLLIALFVTPLPALARGEFGAVGYLGRTLLPIALALVCLRLLLAAWRSASAQETAPPGYGLLRALPGLGGLLLREQQCHGLSLLALLLAGGLPMDRALKITASTLRDRGLRSSCTQAARLASRGAGAVDTIAHSGLCSEPLGLALISSGEAAGRLDDCIARHAADLDFRLNLQLDAITEWLPRLLYFGLVVPWLL